MIKKEEKGITLIVLTVTIAVILIISSTLIYNLDNHISVKELNNLYYDIDMISNKIFEYYLEKGDIPIIENCYFNEDTLQAILENRGATEPVFDVNDGANYYVIDLSQLDNLTLNYGEEYKLCKNYTGIGFTSTTGYMDAYYINPVTLQIYYPKGINYKNKFYYTKSDKESTNPVTAILQDNLENFSRANGTIDIRFISGTSNEAKAENEANAPVLGKNMVPVKFDGSTWIETGSSKSEWEYNYTNKPGESKWANAVVKNEKGEITGYFVWIPRYAYKITYHNENINGDIIGYSDSRGIVSTNGTIVTGGRSRRNAGDYYIVHPAFTNDVNVGGWNSELQGIWVAKYEASGEATNVKLQAKSNEFVTVYKASNSNNEDTSDEQAINYNLSGGYMFGDAIYETSSDGINGNNTWQLHYAHFPYNQEAIFIRGSDSLDSDTGILSFAAGMGNGLSTRSFRPVLTFNIN